MRSTACWACLACTTCAGAPRRKWTRCRRASRCPRIFWCKRWTSTGRSRRSPQGPVNQGILATRRNALRKLPLEWRTTVQLCPNTPAGGLPAVAGTPLAEAGEPLTAAATGAAHAACSPADAVAVVSRRRDAFGGRGGGPEWQAQPALGNACGVKPCEAYELALHLIHGD